MRKERASKWRRHPAARYLIERGLTPAAFAASVKISENLLYQYLLFHKHMSRLTAERLAAATGGAIPPEVWLWPERYPQFIDTFATSPRQTTPEEYQNVQQNP